MLPDAEISFSALAPGVCTEAVYAGDFAPSGSGYLTAGENGFICGSHYIRRGMGYDAWLKENAGQTPSAGESRQEQGRAPAGTRAHAAGKLERDLEAADFFRNRRGNFKA